MRRAILLLPAVLLLAGCGTSSSTSGSDGSDSAKKDATSSRVEWRTEGARVPEWAKFSSAGVIDYAKQRGDLVMRTKNEDGSDNELHARFIGGDTYTGVKLDGKWYWQKSSSGDEPTGADRFLPGPGGTNPDRLLSVLTKASKRVEQLGQEKIRGVAATHYRAHLDKEKLGQDARILPKEPVVEAWIDDAGLARRVRVPYGSGDPVAAAVVDLYDYGVEADIEAPPADEVLSEEAFGKLMEKECRTSAKTPDRATAWCLIFGAGLSVSEGSAEISPTETMPRRVTDR